MTHKTKYKWYKERLWKLEIEKLQVEKDIRDKTEERDELTASVIELRKQRASETTAVGRLSVEIGALQGCIDNQKAWLARNENMHPELLTLSESSADRVRELIEARENEGLSPTLILANTEQSESGQKTLAGISVIHCPSLKRNNLVLRFQRKLSRL